METIPIQTESVNTDMSPLINELAGALAKAQGQMEGAKKDMANPFFKSKYADLASVWEAARKPLSDNGLAVIQTTNGDCEVVTVITTLFHSSGQWIRGTLKMRPSKLDPQGIGSCLTYARRYALAAMVGIAPEDDDGNAASQKNGTPAQVEKPVALTKEQRSTLSKMLEEAGITEEEFCIAGKIESLDALTQGKFEGAKAYISKIKKPAEKKGRAA